MLFLGIAAGIFGLDFFLKRYIEKRYARKVRHPKLGNLIYIEKYYNKGAMLNALETQPGLLNGFNTFILWCEKMAELCKKQALLF